MRNMLLLVGSTVAVAAAAAPAPAKADAPWTPHVQVPEGCGRWARDVDRAETPRQRYSAEMSLASCAASARMDAATLPGGDKSIDALGAAIEPSLTILDDVSLSRDPAYQILAADARADLYVAAITRARAAERDVDECSLAPWQAAADRAYDTASNLARIHPGIVIGDPVVASAVQHGRRAIAPSVAVNE
jgi:hypothetical protein